MKNTKIVYTVLLGAPSSETPIMIKKRGGKRPLNVENVITEPQLLNQLIAYDKARIALKNPTKKNLDEFIKVRFITAFMLHHHLPETYLIHDYHGEEETILGHQYRQVFVPIPRLGSKAIGQLVSETLKNRQLDQFERVVTLTLDKEETTEIALLLKA